jgi:hypothetical protein
MRSYLIYIALIIILCNACAEDTKFFGHSLWYFGGTENYTGAWGWFVSVDRVIDGPQDLVGENVSVYVTSANPEKYPPGFIDPKINSGVNVSVYGLLKGEPRNYHILLVGSDEYYIKPAD